MGEEEINRHNLAVFMPCEFHDYAVDGDGLRVCSECGMYSCFSLPSHTITAISKIRGKKNAHTS